MKTNYQLILDQTLEHLSKETKIPSLLLHVCCAPCSSYVLEYLSNYFYITILYYNPNIYPEEEFHKRQQELKQFLKVQPAKYPIKLIETTFDNKPFHQKIKNLEHLGERSPRCYQCYLLRMEEAAKYAKENHFDYFTTVLSISPYKNSEWINEIGYQLEKEYQINYLPADFKKKNGYLRSLELSKKYNLYRQNYCGCIYSKLELEQKEKSKNTQV